MEKQVKKVALAVACLTLAACSDINPTAPNAAVPSLAVVTAPGQNKLQCFDGPSEGTIYGGACTLPSKAAKGSAVLSLNSSNPNGDYAGVYAFASNMYDTPLSQITQLSYTYSGTISPLPGNLSYNIPISATGTGTTSFYAYVDAYYCPGVAGVVDITADSSCSFYANGVQYANWAGFIAAYPNGTVANDNNVIVIAERTPSEQAAVWTVSNVKFGRAGR